MPGVDPEAHGTEVEAAVLLLLEPVAKGPANTVQPEGDSRFKSAFCKSASLSSLLCRSSVGVG